MLVFGGSSSIKNLNFEGLEIIDVGKKPASECKSLPEVPIKSGNVAGGLALNQVPLICDLGNESRCVCCLLILIEIYGEILIIKGREI